MIVTRRNKTSMVISIIIIIVIIIIIAIIINNITGSSPGIHPPSRTDIFSRSSLGLQTMRSARTWDSGVQVGKKALQYCGGG